MYIQGQCEGAGAPWPKWTLQSLACLPKTPHMSETGISLWKCTHAWEEQKGAGPCPAWRDTAAQQLELPGGLSFPCGTPQLPSGWCWMQAGRHCKAADRSCPAAGAGCRTRALWRQAAEILQGPTDIARPQTDVTRAAVLGVTGTDLQAVQLPAGALKARALLDCVNCLSAAASIPSACPQRLAI